LCYLQFETGLIRSYIETYISGLLRLLGLWMESFRKLRPITGGLRTFVVLKKKLKKCCSCMNLKNTIDVAFVSHPNLRRDICDTNCSCTDLGIHWLHAIEDYCPDRFFWATRFLFCFSLFFCFSAVRWPPRQLLSVGLRKSTASYRIVSYHGPTFLLNLVAPYPYTASSVTPFIILTRFKPIPIISSFLSSIFPSLFPSF